MVGWGWAGPDAGDGGEEGIVSSTRSPCGFSFPLRRTGSGPGRGGQDTAGGAGPLLRGALHSPRSARIPDAHPQPGAGRLPYPDPAPAPPPLRPNTAQAQGRAGAAGAPSPGDLTDRTLCCCAGGGRRGWERKMWVESPNRCDQQITRMRIPFLCP